MSNEPVEPVEPVEPADPVGPGDPVGGEIAQRPRMVSRLRLVPLALLALTLPVCVALGLTDETPVTVGVPASALPKDPAVKAAERAAKAKPTCMPPFSTGVTSEPWEGSRRAASERAFKQHMKRENRYYVRGKDGWKFFTDKQSDNFSQALGRITQTTSQREAWARYLAASEKTVRSAGGRYFLVVSPANWDVYPQKLPDWARRLRGTTSLEKLMEAHPELPWIDTRAALRKAAKQHDTYEPLDSHWTPYGGYVAWGAITRCLRATDKGLRPLTAPPIDGVGVVANSNEFVAQGVPSGKPRRTVPEYSEPHPETTMTHLPDGAPIAGVPDYVTDTLWAPLKTSTPAAQAPGLTLLTLRDSTGNALSPLWSWSFGTTVQYGHGIGQVGIKPPDLKGLMKTHHPQVVLFVMTERFLTQPPPR